MRRAPGPGVVEYWLNALLVDASELLPLAEAADELGFAGIALADHAVMPEQIASSYPGSPNGGPPPWSTAATWPDVWVTIGALAARTTRLRFATNVYVLPARPPLVTAKAVGTAAALSGDRVVLGVGVGWMAEEFAALDEGFGDRGARTDEILAILKQAFDGGVVEWSGQHYAIPRLHLRPAPGRPVPIWIGGESAAALARAVRLGDGWISGRSAADVARDVPALRTALASAGRAREPFEIAASLHGPPRPEELASWSELGIGHLKVAPWTWSGGGDVPLSRKIEALRVFANEYLG